MQRELNTNGGETHVDRQYNSTIHLFFFSGTGSLHFRGLFQKVIETDQCAVRSPLIGHLTLITSVFLKGS